jgi:oxygen-independent coproporphyrinogen-3 oxidase
MDALAVQLETELKRFDVTAKNLIETVFIGGGTPSTVAPELYIPIFDRIRPYLHIGAEITSEANPNSATYEWLEGMKTLGVNRISFGVQSFNDEKLKTLGRAHNTQHALEAIRNASLIGYEHLSLDLIYGVQNDTKELLRSDIDQAFQLPIDHISLYSLTIEEKTEFEKLPEMANEQLDLTQWLFDEITAKGFEQYEISNFGKYRSKHNIGYWEHKPYIGLGAGAVGFLGATRLYPTPDIEAYINAPVSIKEEHLNEAELLNEKFFLGFRSCVGVDQTLLSKPQRAQALMLLDGGLLEFRNERYFNPNFLLADEITLRVEGY